MVRAISLAAVLALALVAPAAGHDVNGDGLADAVTTDSDGDAARPAT